MLLQKDGLKEQVMSQTPQKFTCTGDKPQQTDCLDLFSDVAAHCILRKAKKCSVDNFAESMTHIFMLNTPLFSFAPPH